MLNYKGLRKRPTFDTLIDYLEHHQEIIKYPNRVSTQRMNDNIFNEEYEQLKDIKDDAIDKLLKSDKTTQTDFSRENGMSVNLKKFKEEYEAKLATKRWHLEGGSVKNIGHSNDSNIKSKQIQTMALEVNKAYYGRKKLMNWMNSERPQPEPESEDLKRSIQISQDAFDAITNLILSPLSFLIPATIDTTVSTIMSPIPSPRVYQMFPVTPPLTPSPIPIIIPDPPPIYIPPARTPTPSPVRKPSPVRPLSPITYRVASPVRHHIIDNDTIAAAALWHQTVAMMSQNLY